MIPHRPLLVNLACALAVATVFSFVLPAALKERAESTGLDSLFYLRKPRPSPSSEKIVIIEITDADIAQVGRWPWPRQWFAAIARTLTDLGAKSVFFDFLLTEPSTEYDDALLEEALRRDKNVFLPFAFDSAHISVLTSFQPIKRFSDHAKGTGAINIFPDPDGITRRMPLFFTERTGFFPSAALSLAMDYADLTVTRVSRRSLTLSGGSTHFSVPLVNGNSILINWNGPWRKTFIHHSYLDVLKAYQDLKKSMRPAIDTSEIHDSICLIAVTAVGLYDIKAVPIEAEYPGIGIVANAITNILDRRFLYSPPPWFTVILVYLLCLVAAFLIRGLLPLKEVLSSLLTGTLFFCIAFVLFAKGIRLEFMTPLAGFFVTGTSVGAYHFLRIFKERQQFFKMSVTDSLTGLYNIRYFKMLLETEIALSINDPANKFCLIMSDIDHFKQVNDTYGHQTGDVTIKEVAAVLRSSVRSSDLLGRYGGEEMVVLLRGSALKDGLAVAEKMRKNIQNLVFKHEKGGFSVTASFGVVAYKKGDSAESLIKRADQGLYHVKQTGRNFVYSLE